MLKLIEISCILRVYIKGKAIHVLVSLTKHYAMRMYWGGGGENITRFSQVADISS
jgi:hypothetical protein